MDSPTLTGRLCRPFTDRMLVQWDEQARLYRGAEVVGVVL
jgi:Oligosaccharide biosynthesis protein Alg14 like